MFYWCWRAEIYLPHIDKLSLIEKQFENGMKINQTFDIEHKNQTLLTIMPRCTQQEDDNDLMEKIKLLIDYNYDFVKFGNIGDHNGMTPLMHLCSEKCGIESLKLFWNHCNKIENFELNILQIDKYGFNALHHAMKYNSNCIEFLLSNVYFPKNDLTNKKGLQAIHSQTSRGKTVAHLAIECVSTSISSSLSIVVCLNLYCWNMQFGCMQKTYTYAFVPVVHNLKTFAVCMSALEMLSMHDCFFFM